MEIERDSFIKVNISHHKKQKLQMQSTLILCGDSSKLLIRVFGIISYYQYTQMDPLQSEFASCLVGFACFYVSMLILCVKAITSLAMTYRRHPNSSSLSSGFSSYCLIATLHLASLISVEGTYLHIPLCSSYNVLYKLFFFQNSLKRKIRV